MTFYYNLTNPANYSDYMYSLKEMFKTSGWTVVSSGSNLGYNASGDNLPANTNFVAGSWFVVSHPILDGYQRFLSFQFNGSSGCRVKISWSGFSSGSPSATRVPSAADEKIMFGSGTDASPSYTSVFYSSPSIAHNVLFRFGDAADKFSFYTFAYRKIFVNDGSSDSIPHLFMMDYLEQVDVGDVDPYCYLFITRMYVPTDLYFGNTNIYAWRKKTLSGESWQKYPIDIYGAVNTSVGASSFGTVGSCPYDNSIELFPAVLVRTGVDNAYDGNPKHIKGVMKSMSVSLIARPALSVLSVNAPKDKIFIGPYFVFDHSGEDIIL